METTPLLLPHMVDELKSERAFEESGRNPVAGAIGFEPTTDCLIDNCSTDELRLYAR